MDNWIKALIVVLGTVVLSYLTVKYHAGLYVLLGILITVGTVAVKMLFDEFDKNKNKNNEKL